MKRFSIGAALAAGLLAFALTGCAGPSEPAKTADSASLAGFWVLDNADQIGFDAALNLDSEDNYAELSLSDSIIGGTWATDGTNASITFEAEDEEEGSAKKATIYVSEGKLTLGQANGSKLVFTKGDLDAYNAMQTGAPEVSELDEEDAEVVEEVIKDVEPITVIDNKTCTVKVTGKGNDFTGDPGYRLSVENKTKKAIYITADDVFKVGGKEVEAGLGEVIDAGATVDTFIYFPKDELGGGIEAVKDVSGKVIVGDDDTGDEIATYDFEVA